MRRLFLLFSVFCVLSVGSLSADVAYTDEENQELNQIMDSLEKLVNEQQTTIENLKTENEKLKTQSENRKKIYEEQMKLTEQQQNLYEEDKKSSRKKATLVTIVSNLVTALVFLFVGVFAF